MKRNFLRLCLMLGLLSLNACRQDILADHETYNNSGAFQLTSKRISLNEAQHKTNLIPKIKQVETNLYAESKNNLQGKTVNFGNGISIDTDDVIYLEKGPDFHSYTFRINHENAPANAPIENLVISSRPDGTWKEVLVTYYLTLLERQNLLSGGVVDFTGKVTHEILQNGTYSSAIVMQDVMTCHMEVSTYYTRCGESDDHHNGELTGTAGPCRSDTPSVLVVSLVRKCTVALPVDTGLGENGEGGGSGPQNGPGGLSNNPPEETTTAPNLPTSSEDPCMKTRVSIRAANTVLKNSEVQSQMDGVLKGKVTDPKEFAMKIGDNGNSNYSFSNLVEGAVSSADLNNAILPSGVYIADGHSHAGGFGNPSGGDLYGFLENILTNSGLKYRYVYGNNGGVPEIYALVLNDKTLISDFLAKYPRSENYDPDTHDIKEGSKLGLEFFKAHKHNSEGRSENISGENYANGAVALAYILDKLNVGVSVVHQDASGNFKKINASVTEIEVPYSGGVKKEGVKVSKCP